MRLVDALAALSTESFLALSRKRGVVFDEQKRITPVEQAARQLVTPKELAYGKSISPEMRRALSSFAAEPQGVARESIGGAIVPLVEAGLVFAAARDSARFVMPSTYRLQCPPSGADDPRSLRLLLPHLDEESLQALTAHHLGRLPAIPRLLLLGDLLDKLESRKVVEQTVHTLGPKERALLLAIEARGGEVDPAELLDLAGEPRRYANPTGTGQASSRRSPAYPLLRAGLLFPFGKDAYTIPTEVASVIGKDRRARAATMRAHVRERVASQDLTPQRARFADDPGATTIALLAILKAEGVSLSQEVSAPRTVLKKAGRTLGLEAHAVELLAALARADGLATAAIPIKDIGFRLARMWRRGGAWDESRTEPDSLRAQQRFARISTPTMALVSAVIELLSEVESTRFALVEDVVAAALTDLRASSAAQKLARARRRDRELFEASPEVVVRKVIDQTLPTLGLIDRGQGEDGPVLRLSAQGRKWLQQSDVARPALVPKKHASFAEQARLSISFDAPISHVLALADFTTLHPMREKVVAHFELETIERGYERSIDVADMRARILRVSDSMDEKVEALFARVSAARVRCEWQPASAFVYVSDRSVRDAFLSDDLGASLVFSDSPKEGLLVRAGVSIARIERILRRLGGELVVRRDS
ncbi:MAG: hypothetical protein IPK60_21775 [Sandaracinaceae bacterium]|jgi:hypothetical protein|nr:hypothetical protein [Sandaracinaceae bacterium]